MSGKKIIRKGCIEQCSQTGLLVYFPDIRCPGHDVDEDPQWVMVTGTSRANLLEEVIETVSISDATLRKRYHAFWENEDVVVLEVDAKYLGEADRF